MKTEPKVDPNASAFELKDTIEDVAIQQSLAPEKIVEVLKDVIVEQFAEILNAFEDDIIVHFDEQYRVSVGLMKDVVEEVEEELLEIDLKSAKEVHPEAQLGESVEVPLSFGDLNRKDIKHLDFVLRQKMRNIKNEVVYRDYKHKEGELINGVFLRKRGRDMFIDIGQVEACLPFREQSPREKYKQGDRIKAYVKEISLSEDQRLNIVVSRADPNMVRKLFELEAPELADGTVQIKGLIREAGKKTKMSVYSIKKEVEPVGACVGVSGIRIKAVIKELGGERIDVFGHSDNVKELINRAMQPAKVLTTLIIDEDKRECLVVVDDESYPQALGREGCNIKLACAITQWNISVRTESQVKKHPEFLNTVSRAADRLFSNMETDLNQLTTIDEALIVKLMNAGVMYVADLYEKSEEEIARLENISSEEAKLIRTTLDEMVELVEDDEKASESKEQYMSEVEDQIQDASLAEEDLSEEVEQVEYLVCPSCGHEFEYENQDKCPSCHVEFEFEEEEEAEESDD